MTVAKFVARKLSPAEIENEVGALVEDLSTLAGLEEMVLFGSAVEGRMSEASDLDVVLIFDSAEHARAASRIVYLNRKRSRWPADLICVDRDLYRERSRIGGILYVAAREGRSIYRKAK